MKLVTNQLDLVLTFDTTGSMSPCIAQVRRNAAQLIKDMGEEAPGIRVAICAHGDYCDGKRATHWLDFTSDVDAIVKFINNVKDTGGGDMPECYERVLYEARSLSWKKTNTKTLVMIGDSTPHTPAEALRQGGKSIDWRQEVKSLSDMGISIYGCHALNYSYGRDFYQELAQMTGGFYVQLNQFANIQHTLMAIVLKQVGSNERFSAYEESINRSGAMNRSLDETFATLSGRKKMRYESVDKMALRPVNPARFQVMSVWEDMPIKDYVTYNGLRFKIGRGFYEFTKKETIQNHKEIILQDRVSGDMFTGEEVRRLLSLPEHTTARISVPNDVNNKYRIFVQSTSNNRKLIGGTRFLYEVDTTI